MQRDGGGSIPSDVQQIAEEARASSSSPFRRTSAGLSTNQIERDHGPGPVGVRQHHRELTRGSTRRKVAHYDGMGPGERRGHMAMTMEGYDGESAPHSQRKHYVRNGNEAMDGTEVVREEAPHGANKPCFPVSYAIGCEQKKRGKKMGYSASKETLGGKTYGDEFDHSTRAHVVIAPPWHQAESHLSSPRARYHETGSAMKALLYGGEEASPPRELVMPSSPVIEPMKGGGSLVARSADRLGASGSAGSFESVSSAAEFETLEEFYKETCEFGARGSARAVGKLRRPEAQFHTYGADHMRALLCPLGAAETTMQSAAAAAGAAPPRPPEADAAAPVAVFPPPPVETMNGVSAMPRHANVALGTADVEAVLKVHLRENRRTTPAAAQQ